MMSRPVSLRSRTASYTDLMRLSASSVLGASFGGMKPIWRETVPETLWRRLVDNKGRVTSWRQWTSHSVRPTERFSSHRRHWPSGNHSLSVIAISPMYSLRMRS